MGSLSIAVLEAIGAISAQLRSRFAQGGEPGVGFVGLATLRHLVRHGPRSVTELARSEGVTTQAISLRLSPLVGSGLAARSRDPLDARRTLVDVTQAGHDLVTRSQARVVTALEAAIDALTDAERAALATALPALVRIGAELDKDTT